MHFMLDIEDREPEVVWDRIGALQICLERGMDVPLEIVFGAKIQCVRLLENQSFIEKWSDREGIFLALRYTAESLNEIVDSHNPSIIEALDQLNSDPVNYRPPDVTTNLYRDLKRSHLLPYERRIELQERIIKSRVSAELIEKRGGVGSLPHQVLSILQTAMLVDDEVFDEVQRICLKELEEAGVVEWDEGEGAWRMWDVKNIVWHRDARLDWRLPGMGVKVSTWFKDESYHVGFEYDLNQWTFLKKVIEATIADYGTAGLRAEKTVAGHVTARWSFDYQLVFDNEFRARDFIEEIMKYLREQKEKGTA